MLRHWISEVCYGETLISEGGYGETLISEGGYGETVGCRRWLWGYSGHQKVILVRHWMYEGGYGETGCEKVIMVRH
jgi:hypothetical protein